MSSGKKEKIKTKHADIAWEHGHPVPGNPHGAICKYCNQIMKSGGITRLKEHLAWTSSNVRNCPKVPTEVRQIIRANFQKSAATKKARNRREKSIAAELGGLEDIVDLDDDDDEDDDDELRKTMEASRAAYWDAEERVRIERDRPTFEGSVREVGTGSGSGAKVRQRGDQTGISGGIKRFLDRTGSLKGAQPKLYGEVGGSQKKMTQMYKKGKDSVKNVGKYISKFFHENAIPSHAADTVSFKNMIAVVQMEGEKVPPPSGKEIMGSYLDEAVKETIEWIDSHKPSQNMYGLTLMCDGWTGPTKLSIINFMGYCRGISFFIKSIDASREIKDARYIQKELEKMIGFVGAHHIIQIVTDNGSAFKKAGKNLEKKYPFYWTPCAAHCIDLMLEDIGRRPTVRTVISDAREITKYIYNHSWVLAMFHEVSGYTGEIVRPGKTRFATNYIALHSLWKARQALANAFNSEAWDYAHYSRQASGIKVASIINNYTFWDSVRWVLSILEPIYSLLRVVDNETYPNLGSLYEGIRVMKDAIEKKHKKGVKWVIDIINKRWEDMLEHPLHAAAYYLNPKYHYSRNLGDDTKLGTAVFEVYEKLFPNDPNSSEFGNELMAFREARGLFGKKVATDSRTTAIPCEWWSLYGTHTPTLRRLAARILSQTVSSSPCERNWSTFSLIHTQRRNRLGYERLQKLVFVHYNSRLRERLLRAADSEPEDPLDLMAIGQYAYLEAAWAQVNDNDEEDPLYEWLRSHDLDERDGGPSHEVAKEAQKLGINVDEVIDSQRKQDKSFDPLTRTHTQSVGETSTLHATQNTSSSSSTRSGGLKGQSDNDDSGNDDAAGGVGISIASGGYDMSQSQQPLSQFTGEEGFTHATQDADHGARATFEQTLSRNKGKGAIEEESLKESLASINLSNSGLESSYACENEAYESGTYDYISPGWGSMRLIPQAGSCWSSPPHELYQPAPQPPSLYFNPTQFQPYGYTSTSSTSQMETGTNETSSSNIFGIINSYGYISGYGESTHQNNDDDNDDDDIDQASRHSFWY